MTVQLEGKDRDFYSDVRELARDLATIAAKREESRFELVKEIQRVTHRLTELYGQQADKPVDGSTLAGELMQHYEDLFNNKIPFLSSGIPGLDVSLGGFSPQRVYLFAARPGQGKTSLIVTIKKSHLDLGRCVYIASAEMSRLAIGERLVAQYSDFPVSQQRPGITNFDLKRLLNAANEVGNKRIFINDRSYVAVEDVDRQIAELTEAGNKPDIVFIDYVQLLRSNIVDRRASEFDRLSYVSSEVLAVAKRHDVPIVCAAQENREADKRSGGDAKLSDIRGAGQFEQDAHFVAHIKNERPADGNDERVLRSSQSGKPIIYRAQLKISKNRTGPTGDVDLVYHAPRMEFADYNEAVSYGKA